MPDRVLRQFGFVQTVPRRTLQLVTAPGGTKPLNYVPARFNWVSDFFTEWQRHVIGDEERQPVVEMSDCSDDYMAYYAEHGHPKLLNPQKERPEFVGVLAPLPHKNVLYTALVNMVRKTLLTFVRFVIIYKVIVMS